MIGRFVICECGFARKVGLFLAVLGGLCSATEPGAGRVVLPAAAQGLHQADAGVELTRLQIHGQAALGDDLSFGIEHRDLCGETGLVALHGKGIGLLGFAQRFGLQRLLAAQVRGSDLMDSPAVVKDFLRSRLGHLPHEVFAVVHLDAQNRVLDYVEMFRGTVSQTSVYPREVVRDALLRNSCALVLVHNHPSGAARPSRADEVLTQTLKQAAALVDVRVLDNFIVAGDSVNSMAELGMV